MRTSLAQHGAITAGGLSGETPPLGFALPALTVLFQPILDTITGAELGFEALTRLKTAPESGFPRSILEEARERGSLRWLNERLASQAMRAFAASSLPGLLFLNVSPGVISREDEGVPFRIEEPSVPNDRVVIELTEDEPTVDYRLMRESLLYFRERGFTIALDDFGEGFASLRLWSELHPRFVKIDRHLVSGIDRDFLKEQFVEAFQRVASRCGVSLVAEGVETPRELAVLRRLGIRYAQGYLLGRPAAGEDWRRPLRIPGWVLEDRQSLVARPGRRGGRDVERLVRRIAPADTSESVERVFVRLESTPDAKLIPVTSGEGFVVTDGGRYLGVGETKALMLEITDLELQAARYANPLTLLPGNVPIDGCATCTARTARPPGRRRARRRTGDRHSRTATSRLRRSAARCRAAAGTGCGVRSEGNGAPRDPGSMKAGRRHG